MLFPARAALDSIQFSRRLGDSIRILRTALAGGSSWIRTSVIFHNATVFCTVSVSTTNQTKSHFKAHFSLSFAEVSQASVSLYFKCALEWRLSLDLNQPLLNLVVSRIPQARTCYRYTR